MIAIVRRPLLTPSFLTPRVSPQPLRELRQFGTQVRSRGIPCLDRCSRLMRSGSPGNRIASTPGSRGVDRMNSPSRVAWSATHSLPANLWIEHNEHNVIAAAAAPRASCTGRRKALQPIARGSAPDQNPCTPGHLRAEGSCPAVAHKARRGWSSAGLCGPAAIPRVPAAAYVVASNLSLRNHAGPEISDDWRLCVICRHGGAERVRAESRLDSARWGHPLPAAAVVDRRHQHHAFRRGPLCIFP